MNYEEKLRLTKEALDSGSYDKETIEYIFPELKENEDERIRKFLYDFINNIPPEEWNKDKPNEDFRITVLDWLEKQGELSVKLKFYKDLNKIHKKNHTEIVRELIAEHKKECVEYANEEYWKGYKEGKQAVSDKYAELEKQAEQPNKVSIWKHWNNGIAGNEEGKLIYLIKSGNTYRLSSCLGFECDYIELSELDKLYVEKQCEQKPTDKVEPKFKVGDWIVSEYGNINTVNQVIKVEPIDDEYFSYTLDDKTYFDSSWENSYRLWTIQDAKDGDVLATDERGICIFDGTVEEGKYPFAYCGITERGFEVYDRRLPFTHANVHLATKEQRELLFSKIKEAGYKWNAEKKELKKIEQEDDTELTDFESALFSAFSDSWQEYLRGEEVNVAKWAREHSAELLEVARKQKPAWSEEDEKIYKVVLEILSSWSKGTIGSFIIPPNTDRYINWLKSLKKRMKGE